MATGTICPALHQHKQAGGNPRSTRLVGRDTAAFQPGYSIASRLVYRAAGEEVLFHFTLPAMREHPHRRQTPGTGGRSQIPRLGSGGDELGSTPQAGVSITA